jgi:hypothetical protein
MKARSQKPKAKSRGVAALLLLASGFWLLAFAEGGAQRATREQRAIVAVVDKNDKTVAGLGPADFTVRENNVAREVVRVETAADPMQVMLLVDTSSGTRVMMADIRSGVRQFARVILEANPESEIGLMEFGERPVVIADRASVPNLIDRAADRLNEHSGSGAYMLEAIVDATKILKKREGPRPVIVAFVRSSSPEFSNQNHQAIEAAVKDARASLWVILLQDAQRSTTSEEGQQREMVMGDVVTRSGGLRDILLDKMGLEKGFQEMGELLASQYAVVYARPESLIPPSKLDVTTKRSGARALAPRWTGQ